MLLTYNSLLVTRKTDVWGRRFSVLSTWSQLCDILWRICIHLLRTTRTKKDVGSTWEANLILGAESQMFWDPPIIGYFWQTTSSLIFFCQVLNGEFQAYLPQRMQPALGVKCPLTAAAPVRWSLPAPPGACGRWQRFSARVGSPPPGLPGLSIQSMTSGCQTVLSFSNKWSWSHSGSPWLREGCAWWTIPRSSWTLPASWLQKDFQRLCRQKLRCMSHTDLLIRFSFSCENEVLLWNSLIRNLLGWHLSDDQAGIENILIGILFLRNKS